MMRWEAGMGYGVAGAYNALFCEMMTGLCTGVLEIVRAEKEERRRKAVCRRVQAARKRSLNPAPTASKVSAQWRQTRISLLETLRFGSLLLDLEPTVDSSLIVQYNRACTRQVIVARNPGLKGWLHDNCREVGYRTALRYKNLAERLRKACGLPHDTPLEWAVPDQARFDDARRRKTKGDLKDARAKLVALLAECPNVLRLQARLDVLQSVEHRKLAKPRKPLSQDARRRREERVVETLLRTVRCRAVPRLPNLERETRDHLFRGLLNLVDELKSSTA